MHCWYCGGEESYFPQVSLSLRPLWKLTQVFRPAVLSASYLKPPLVDLDAIRTFSFSEGTEGPGWAKQYFIQVYICTRDIKKAVSKALWDSPNERHQIKAVITKMESQVF